MGRGRPPDERRKAPCGIRLAPDEGSQLARKFVRYAKSRIPEALAERSTNSVRVYVHENTDFGQLELLVLLDEGTTSRRMREVASPVARLSKCLLDFQPPLEVSLHSPYVEFWEYLCGRQDGGATWSEIAHEVDQMIERCGAPSSGLLYVSHLQPEEMLRMFNTKAGDPVDPYVLRDRVRYYRKTPVHGWFGRAHHQGSSDGTTMPDA